MQFITIPATVFEVFYKARFVDHKRFSSVVSITSYHQSSTQK